MNIVIQDNKQMSSSSCSLFCTWCHKIRHTEAFSRVSCVLHSKYNSPNKSTTSELHNRGLIWDVFSCRIAKSHMLKGSLIPDVHFNSTGRGGIQMINRDRERSCNDSNVTERNKMVIQGLRPDPTT